MIEYTDEQAAVDVIAVPSRLIASVCTVPSK